MRPAFRRLGGSRMLATLALVPLLAVAACGGGGGEPVADGPNAPATVRVALPGGPNVSLSIYLAGQGTGAFDKRGITAQTQEFATGVDAMAALTGGSVDVANTTGLDTFRAVSQGGELVAFYVVLPSSGSAIVAQKKFEQSKGTDLAKFGDARWGYAREGTVSTFYLQTLAEKAGLNWASLQRGALGSQSALLASLQADRIDLVTTDATTAAKAVETGTGYIVLNTSDPAATTPYWGPQAGSVMVTTREYFDAHPDVIARYTAGLADGANALAKASGDANAVLNLFTPEVRDKLSGSFAGQWDITKAVFTQPDGRFTDDLVNSTLSWAKASGALPADLTLPPLETFIDNSMVEKARAESPT